MNGDHHNFQSHLTSLLVSEPVAPAIICDGRGGQSSRGWWYWCISVDGDQRRPAAELANGPKQKVQKRRSTLVHKFQPGGIRLKKAAERRASVIKKRGELRVSAPVSRSRNMRVASETVEGKLDNCNGASEWKRKLTLGQKVFSARIVSSTDQ